MPELPDVTLYVEALHRSVVGHRLERLRVMGPSVLRTVQPRAGELDGKTVTGAERLGKRIVLAFEDDLFVVMHLMIAGRLHWRGPGPMARARTTHAAFAFAHGTLLLTEASSKKRASLHVLRGRDGLAPLRPAGVEPLECDLDAFRGAVTRGNHTLKRALTDPSQFSGIGNAYSDEILHRARLSPVKLAARLDDAETSRLFDATRETLTEWTKRLRADVGDGFPEKVTAFRPDMGVHGRFGKPCPVCASPVQRIVYAENEANYCATCQTGGKLLADRALSRLMRGDWPATLEEMEERVGGRRRR